MASADIIVRVIDETQAQISQIKSRLNQLKDSTDSVNNSIRNLVAAYVSLETGKAFLQQVDQVQQLDAKLRLVSTSQADFNKNYDTVFEIAQKTRQPLNETGDLYAKISRSAGNLGITTSEVAKVTETFNIALQRSGAAGPAAAGSITQFAQALQSGKFQGDEFKTINEVIPEVLDIISKKTGFARESLKQYASEGLLTGKIAAQALIESHGELEQGTKTLNQAIVQLKNQFQKSIKSFLDTTGAGDILIKTVEFLTENMDNLIVMGKAAGIALAALAIKLRPISVLFTAATTAAIALADVLGPILRPVVDFVESAFSSLGKQLVGFGAAIRAFAQGKNPLDAYTLATLAYADAAKKGTLQGDELKHSTEKQAEAAAKNAKQTDTMKRLIAEAEKEANKGKISFDNFKSSLLANAAASAEDGKSKEYATLLYKAYEVKAKDLKIAVSALTEEQKKQVENEVGGLIESKIANDIAYKAREKNYQDSVNLLKKYGDDFQKFNEKNLTLTETTTRELADIEKAYNTVLLHDKKMTAEQRQKIEQDRVDAISLVTQKGIIDLSNQFKKYSDDSRTDAQKLAFDLKRIEEARQVAGLEGEANYQIALTGLRDRAYSKYRSQIEDAANFALTREERLTKDLLKVDEEFRAVNAEMTAQHQAARSAVIFKANEEIYKSGLKYLEDNLSAEAVYNKRLMEIEAARAGTSTENQKYLNAALLAINKEYIDRVIGQYPLIYKEYEQALLKVLGISNEKFAKLKEGFKLFGVDVDAILKDLFVQGIRHLIGFTNSANQNINSVQGVVNAIFGSQGTASTSIFDFATNSTGFLANFLNTSTSGFTVFGRMLGSVFSSAYSTITSIFGNIGSFLSSNVLSLLDKIIGGASSAVSALARVVGGSIGGGGGGGLLSSIISIGTSLFSFFSDERTKKNISYRQSLGNGINLYDFNYRSPYSSLYGTGRKTGVIAQDVQQQYPNAVSLGKNGKLLVDYSQLPIPFDMLRFAKGGIVSTPTRGLLGEAGPEAILPLTRTSTGDLGVRSELPDDQIGEVNITFNISAVDARGLDQLLMERQTLITNMVRKAVNRRSRTGVTL